MTSIFICLVTSVFISITCYGVMSFSGIKKYEIHVNAFISVKVLGMNSFHVMAENWKYVKGTLAFLSYFCVRIEIKSCYK